MSTEILVLSGTAVSLGFFHTLFGPDHYLPFVMISYARKWSWMKTSLLTFFCGLGHVLSSVVLGLIGIAVGYAVKKLELVESVRGEVAAWLLIVFGLLYMVWGIRRAWQNKEHTHGHGHIDGEQHSHEHDHHDEHTHIHAPAGKKSITPWVLFIIFVFGPCEPLIPLLMYPAATESLAGVIWVAFLFSFTTIATMMAAVLMLRAGITFVPMHKMERYSHAFAGGAILMCGLAIQFLGL